MKISLLPPEFELMKMRCRRIPLRRRVLFILLFFAAVALPHGSGTVPSAGTPVRHAEGYGVPWFEVPAVLQSSGFAPAADGVAASGGTEFYDHGEPTPFEQLMLELVNRARADPGAEAARLEIDLNENLEPGTIADIPKQPLAFHPALIDAARAHSDWMLANDTFSHEGEGGSTPSERAMAAGYPSGAGENIAWGGTTGTVDPEASTRGRHDGLFRSPGHRLNILHPNYHEVGLGISLGTYFSSGTDWNALMATQKFGSSQATGAPYMVGVVYYDFDGDGFYGPGEGIAGIEVTVDGGGHYTLTAGAGGYALPVPAAGGTREVRFSGPMIDEVFDVEFPVGANHKVDLVLDYEAPALSGDPEPVVGVPTPYTVSGVPGATAMHVTTYRSEPTPPDDADDLSRVVDGTSPMYDALSTTVKHEGAAAYRFAHPSGTSDEILQYIDTFYVGEGAEMRFFSRLGWATSDQEARVEVSDDDGASWSTVYSQSGTGSPGETSFHERVVPLGAYAGSTVRIRFSFRFAGGSYYPSTSDGVGWFVDTVEFVALDTVEELGTEAVSPGEVFTFVAPAERTYRFEARPEHPGGFWPAGPVFHVTAVAGAESGYAAWAAQREAAAGLPAGTLAAHPAADHSGDGITNLVAYALGLDPLVSSAHQRPGWAVEPDLSFVYTVDLDASDTTVIAELSTDLANWHAPGAAALGFVAVDESVSVTGSVQTRRITFPAGLPPSVYARVRVGLP